MFNRAVKIGKKLNKDVKAEISDMNQPLGKYVGNNLEIKEVIDDDLANLQPEKVKENFNVN